MTPRSRRHLLLLAVSILVLAAVSCATEPPKPFEAGAATTEPFGCTVLRQREGEC